MSSQVLHIISGGQTGVDRAALDAARSTDLTIGGWCPRGRIAEDGPLDARYPLEETPSEAYEQRTMWNVRDADATLIIAPVPELAGGTRFTRQVAEGLQKPSLVLVLDEHASMTMTADWILRHNVRVLNVAGPRESGHPGIYQTAHAFLSSLFRFIAECDTTEIS
ncbi:MAG: molybdenum cofactor carrier [Ignavibacteria bacterium]|nr:MAG: molybdenum cofactor carrier [Ignavibacteria bacterium]